MMSSRNRLFFGFIGQALRGVCSQKLRISCICNHVGSAVKSLYISYVLLNTMEKTQKSAKLSWINLSELNIPGEFLIESRLICGQISLTIATDKSLHDLITGKDIRERPVIPDLVWFNLWGDESGN